MTSAAPTIAPEGIADIISRIAPFTFNNGMDASLGVEFSDHGESIRFALEVTDLEQLNGGLDEFMAAVRDNQEDLAERLSAGRSMARQIGEELNIDLAGLSTAASWPILTISAGPYIPGTDDDEDHEDEDDEL
jgi:hypothetical protein